MNKDKLLTDLKEAVEGYLNEYVKLPTFETCENDIFAQDKIVNCLILLEVMTDIILRQGICIDKDFLKQLPSAEIKKRIKVLSETIQDGYLSKEALELMEASHNRKFLLPYLGRELNWVAVSILSASYISSFIIMRSIFELLVGIATSNTGSMKEKVRSIPFLSSEEQKAIAKLWNYLNGWSHPYGRWVKEVCPIYISHRPRYHVKFCNQAIENLIKLIDFFLVIGLEKFEISKKVVLSELKDFSVDDLELTLFHNRY